MRRTRWPGRRRATWRCRSAPRARRRINAAADDAGRRASTVYIDAGPVSADGIDWYAVLRTDMDERLRMGSVDSKAEHQRSAPLETDVRARSKDWPAFVNLSFKDAARSASTTNPLTVRMRVRVMQDARPEWSLACSLRAERHRCCRSQHSVFAQNRAWLATFSGDRRRPARRQCEEPPWSSIPALAQACLTSRPTTSAKAGHGHLRASDIGELPGHRPGHRRRSAHRRRRPRPTARSQFVVTKVEPSAVASGPRGERCRARPAADHEGPTGRSRDPECGAGQAALGASSSPSIVHRRERWRYVRARRNEAVSTSNSVRGPVIAG